MELTLSHLCNSAKQFAECISQQTIHSLFGVTDSKAVGTYIEHEFRKFLIEKKYQFDEFSAKKTLDLLQTHDYQKLLKSLVFLDDKRPIKSSLLNKIDWSKIAPTNQINSQFNFGFL